MCGRFTLTTPSVELERRFLIDLQGRHGPRYNVAPGQEVLAVVAAGGERRPARLQWGFVPAWAKDPRPGPINARAETALQRPMFRQAIRRRRCLIPADGFYEWWRREKARLPVLFRLRAGEPFAFAGLYERWDGPGGPRWTCCILTTRPNDLVAQVHDRMPVILRPEWEEAWLDPEVPPEDLEPAWEPYPAELMEAHPVSPRVNSPRYDDPSCLVPAGPPLAVPREAAREPREGGGGEAGAAEGDRSGGPGGMAGPE
ncbi:SOS response-associated peptidase [Thermaerobacter litoralis]